MVDFKNTFQQKIKLSEETKPSSPVLVKTTEESPAPDAVQNAPRGIRSRWATLPVAAVKKSQNERKPNTRVRLLAFTLWVIILACFADVSRLYVLPLLGTHALTSGSTLIPLALCRLRLCDDGYTYVQWANQLSRRRPAEAIEFYDAAVRANPKEPNLYIARADNFERLKRNDDALKDFAQAISLRPDYVIMRAHYLERQKHYRQAIKDFTTSIEDGGQYSSYQKWVDRAECYSKDGQWQLAIDDLKEAIARNHHHPENNSKLQEQIYFYNAMLAEAKAAQSKK